MQMEKAMTKAVVWVLAALLGLAALIFGAQMVASESGEVVVLTSNDPQGVPVRTRLWVVDHDGSQYLRASPGSGWYARLAADPAVTLRRGGDTGAYRALPAPAERDKVNQLMRAKYGWRDVLISWLVGSRDDAIPVRLSRP